MNDYLTKWRCDMCGEDIESADDGYVIWKSDAKSKEHGFKIIHAVKCDTSSSEYTMSSALNDFLGDRGLTILLSKLSPGPIKGEQGEFGCQIADLDEYVDFMRRVQTPHYEDARRHFKNSSLLDDYFDANEVAPYLPENLKRIVDRYS